MAAEIHQGAADPYDLAWRLTVPGAVPLAAVGAVVLSAPLLPVKTAPAMNVITLAQLRVRHDDGSDAVLAATVDVGSTTTAAVLRHVLAAADLPSPEVVQVQAAVTIGGKIYLSEIRRLLVRRAYT